MKVLLLTPQLPYPPHQGTTLRNFHLLRWLATQHEVTLLSFIEGDSADFSPLLAYCHEIVPIAVPKRTTLQRLRQMARTHRSDMEHRLASDAFDRALTNLLREEKFDIVQIEGLELARRIELVRSLSPTSRIVFDNHNAETALQQSIFATDVRHPLRWAAAAYSWVQTKRLYHFEQWACQSADAVTLVSSADLPHLPPTTTPITVIPNCIDTETYRLPTTPIRFDLVFTGKMDYRPNIDGVLWFAEKVWPLLRAQHTDLTCAIVGQKPHPKLRSCDGIEIVGAVPTVLPYLQGGRVYILPLRMGSGTRLKLIEAMAAGIPIVSTTAGCAGYPVTDNVEIKIADSAEAFAHAITTLLTHPEQAAAITKRGIEFAQNYDWRTVFPALGEVYRSIQKEK